MSAIRTQTIDSTLAKEANTSGVHSHTNDPWAPNSALPTALESSYSFEKTSDRVQKFFRKTLNEQERDEITIAALRVEGLKEDDGKAGFHRNDNNATALQKVLSENTTFNASKPVRSLPEEYYRLNPRAQAPDYVTLFIQEVFDNFDSYRRGWLYFEDGEWKEVYGIFSRPAGDVFSIEFDELVETRNVSRTILRDSVVKLRRKENVV